MSINIIQAIRDQNLIGPFLGEDVSSWQNWFAALRCLYGLPLPESNRLVVEECTGRSLESMPKEGFDTALFLTGRRSGKSRTAAVIGAYEACLAGHEEKLSKGEQGIVGIMAPTRWQSTIVRNYVRSVFTAPLLAKEIYRDDSEGFMLNGSWTSIQTLTGDWRTVRGHTLLAAIIDEAAFFGYDSEGRIRSDTELIRAVQPSLATIGGKLIAISSPYAMRGWCYDQWKRHFGNNDSDVLVWNAPSRTMNPTLPQKVVDRALAEDYASAQAEYLGKFRDDVGLFLPRAVVECLVVQGRQELMPDSNIRYVAFADLSGGRGDDAALAIAHRNGRDIIVDCLRQYKPPFDPYFVCGQMCETLKQYSICRVTGDNYAADFVARSFVSQGIRYEKSAKPKSALYLELLPRLCSMEIELLDNPVLINQLCSLERRTRSGGKDLIDHGPNGHDDLANVVAGVAEVATYARRVVGSLDSLGSGTSNGRDHSNDNERKCLALALGRAV